MGGGFVLSVLSVVKNQRSPQRGRRGRRNFLTLLLGFFRGTKCLAAARSQSAGSGGGHSGAEAAASAAKLVTRFLMTAFASFRHG